MDADKVFVISYMKRKYLARSTYLSMDYMILDKPFISYE